MGAGFSALYRMLSTRRWSLAVLMVAWAAFVGVSIPRLRLVNDLFQALPSDPGVDRFRDLLATGPGADRLMVGFTAGSGVPPDSAMAASDRFVQAVRSGAGAGLVMQVDNTPDPQWFDAAVDVALRDLPAFADTAALSRLLALDDHGLDSLMGMVRARLLGPGGLVQEPLILGDPALLLGGHLQALRARSDLGGVDGSSGVLLDRSGTTAVVLMRPRPDLPDTALDRLVDEVRLRMAEACGTGVQAEVFGPAAIARANNLRVAADTRRTTVISVALFLLLLLLHYRKWSMPVLVLLPAAFGLLNALSILAWVAPTLSSIALGVSATLLGIALDYALHHFTHLRHSRDVERTVRDVAAPLLLGCFTTILAFMALRTLDAPLLRDLGLMAALMLGSAALFTLVVLPHVPVRWPAPPSNAARSRATPGWRRRVEAWSPLAVLVITLALWPFVDRVRFEDDPERMSYMPDTMRELRERLFGAAGDLRTVFIVSEAEDEEGARRAATGAVHRLRTASPAPFVTLVSPTDLLPADSVRLASRSAWGGALQRTDTAVFRSRFLEAADRAGFVAEAFAPLLRSVAGARALPVDSATKALLEEGAVTRLPDGRVRVVSLARVRPGDEDHVEALLAGTTSEVLHRGLLGDRLKTLVGDELQRILWLTSLLVFGVLLITYGRIELAVITFLPMLLSWVWILGICGLFDIPFNMVNVLVCTFIFGLGDDYCLFTSSGILNRYRDGSDDLPAIRTGVVLSVASTVIGTGVLLLAEHPALRSIALLSVVGMLCILVISLTVQPVLFRWLITGRAAKGRLPFTLRSLLISLFAFVYFLAGCLVQLAVLPLVAISPIPRETKRRVFGRSLKVFTRSLVYVMANVRKDVQDFRPALRKGPAILVANHASFVDILVMLMVHPRTIMMTNRWVWNSPFFGAFVRFTGFVRSEDDIVTNTVRVRDAVQRGWSLVVFPEGTRSRDGRIGRFHKGAFHMAQELRLPVVPVLLHGVGYAMAKSDAMLKDTTITMRTLPAIMPDDPRFPQEPLKERTKAIAAWFRKEHTALREARETPSFFRGQLVRAFTYKGPVLEWYIRIKSRIDARLDERIHALLPRAGDIVDLGCGYGPLTYLLHWSAPERKLLGVDHDADKVAVAAHSLLRGDNLRFETADLLTWRPPPADAYVLKDVLHYLPMARQEDLLRSCAEALRPGGVIVVRDGFTGDAQRHARTRWTERFSTGLGFNKTAAPLTFMGRKDLERMAAAHGLRLEWVDEGRITSNALATLTKPA
ncbi:MAG: 1-acyl-sn-glycerol-3-phosphate acyltransferase [Flavobacteriales bacterium]|nr:1-acyl-sn-glycerol-3-phosphate acyltransferase [Flavobacteriales bacterium]